MQDWAELCRHLDELRASMTVGGAAPIRAKIKEIVPEYSFLVEELAHEVANKRAHNQFSAVAGND